MYTFNYSHSQRMHIYNNVIFQLLKRQVRLSVYTSTKFLAASDVTLMYCMHANQFYFIIYLELLQATWLCSCPGSTEVYQDRCLGADLATQDQEHCAAGPTEGREGGTFLHYYLILLCIIIIMLKL